MVSVRSVFARSALALFLVASRTDGQSIFTIAGGGTDDGRPATVASLRAPSGVAIDRAGNLFVVDSQEHRVRKVTADTGIITTIAGTGVLAFDGDGGLATQASFYEPRGVAVDVSGNVYIADGGNARIRKIDALTNIVTTFAGGVRGDFGFTGDGRPATEAALARPNGVAIDASGNLFIAETFMHRIRKVTATTGIITTVAGRSNSYQEGGFAGDGGAATAALLNQPRGVAVDDSGNVYIADQWNHRIRRVDAATGIITTAAGNGVRGFSSDRGPATSASLSIPTGVAVDRAGNIYIADYGNDRIRVVSSTTGVIDTIVGNGAERFSGDGGPATLASLQSPEGIAIDTAGNIHIADHGNKRLRRVNASGIIMTVAGSDVVSGNFSRRVFLGDGGPATAALLHRTPGVALDTVGNLYIADEGNSLIRKVASATGIVSTVAGNGWGIFAGDGGLATAASIDLPRDVATDRDGNLYIADTGNDRVRKVSAANGIITTIAGAGMDGFSGDGGPATTAQLSQPIAVSVSSGGNVYIADSENHRIRMVTTASGIITTVAGSGVTGRDSGSFSGDGGPATAATLDTPSGIAFDTSENLYIADCGNSRIRKISAATGIISTVAGDGTKRYGGDGGPATMAQIAEPAAIAIDSAGNLYIAESNRIRKVSVHGIISTIVNGATRFSSPCGTPLGGYSGDRGRALNATLSSPSGLALDKSGNLYIADMRNSRIRAVFACVNVGTLELQSPADHSSGVATPPRLAWAQTAGAFRYDVVLDTENPPRLVIASDLTQTTFSPANLQPATTYYWRGIAKGDPFCDPLSSSESAIRTFTTAAACVPPNTP